MSDSIYYFVEGQFVQNYRKVLFQLSTERSLSSPSQILFQRPFIDGASVVVPRCYMLLCLCMFGAVQFLSVLF